MVGTNDGGVAARVDAPGVRAPALPVSDPPEVPVRFRPTPGRPSDRSTRTRRAWHALGGAPGVVLVALVAGIAAYVFASQHDLMLLYADARSHLTIARRLIDGPNHGIVQLGTVWLPLPHVVLVPFVALKSWWHTGVAAIPVDLACLVVEALALFTMVRTLTARRWAGWIAVLLLVANPSVLYLHTTALTEPVLFASLLLTASGLTHWACRDKALSGGEIAVYCGLPAAAAVLSRYDGWAFVVAATLFVGVVAQMRWHQWRYSIHIARCFATPAMVAAAWWLWFNWTRFGDPLEFQRGKYSAQAQQELLAKAHRLPDMGDLPRSVHTFAAAVWMGAGWILVGAAIVGMVLWAVRNRLAVRSLAPWLLVVVPFGFYVASLYTGQAALRLDTAGGQSMFNLRYGVEVVPGLAVFAALGTSMLAPKARAGRRRRVRQGVVVLALGLVAVQAMVWWPGWRSVPVVEEGLGQRAAGAGQYAAATWMAAHARHGIIAIDDSVNPLLPVIDADLDRVAAPFSGPRWRRTLRDLRRAEWLYVDTENPQDAIHRAVDRDASFRQDFVLRHRDGKAEVWQRRGSP